MNSRVSTIRLPARRSYRVAKALPQHISIAVFGVSILVAALVLGNDLRSVRSAVAEQSLKIAAVNLCHQSFASDFTTIRAIKQAVKQ